MKLPCQSPYHPFKQKTYEYHPDYKNDISSPKYCTSCMAFKRTSMLLLQAVVMPKVSLYGSKVIELDRATAHTFIDELYDGQ